MSDDLTLDVINLKYIGAAFDRTIKDLELIQTAARNKDEVGGVIADLKELETKVAALCRQNWFRKFEL